MAKFGKTEWAGVLLSLGGGAVVALVAAPELPTWSIFVLTAVAGFSLSGSAYLLGWFRAPVPTIGPPVKTALVLLLIWVPLGFLLKHELPGPSFPFIKPAAVLNPNSPGAFWVFIVVNRGHSELYNVDMSFQDIVLRRKSIRLHAAISSSQYSW